MSLRQRGEEVSVQFLLNGAPLLGSWKKVIDLEVTPQQDLKETDFLGETETDYDRQHHGWAMTFTMHNLDAALIQFLDDLVETERQHLPPEDLRIQVLYSYRDPGVKDMITTYYRGICKFNSEGMRGRKDYVETKLEGRYQRRKTQVL